MRTKSRFQYETWKNDYLKGVQMAVNDKPVKALEAWLRISGLGMSFAAKHLRFWSKKYPVLDRRMSFLLCGSSKLVTKAERYEDFLELLFPLKKKFGSNNLEAESALYAFSQNYFTNSELTLREGGFQDTTDFSIAITLTKLDPD